MQIGDKEVACYPALLWSLGVDGFSLNSVSGPQSRGEASSLRVSARVFSAVLTGVTGLLFLSGNSFS